MSIITLYASGTQAATVTTEHFLSSPNVVGSFRLHVDLSNMVAGDVLELRVYKMVLTAGTSRVVWVEQWVGAQSTDALIVITDPVYNTLTDTNAVRFSLTQTFRTSRNFAWAVINENDGTNDFSKADTIADLAQGIPPATPTLEEAIMYLYSALRNKGIADSSANEKQFFNDADVLIWKKAITKAASTYTEAEGASGP